MLPEDLQDLEAEMGNCCTIHLCLLSASVRCTPGHEMCFWNAGVSMMWKNTLKIRGKEEVGHTEVSAISSAVSELFPEGKDGVMLPKRPNVQKSKQCLKKGRQLS